MTKDAGAYRTIGEVAEALALPQHVLRFWETRIPQIDPLKRGGGRRYYRPDQVALIGRIKDLLYQEGYTIKGVQRLLKTQGLKSVVAAGSEPHAVDREAPPDAASQSSARALEAESDDLVAVAEAIEQCRRLLAEARVLAGR